MYDHSGRKLKDKDFTGHVKIYSYTFKFVGTRKKNLQFEGVQKNIYINFVPLAKNRIKFNFETPSTNRE